MKLAILSDIHGNLPALENVVRRIRHVDQVICLGDVVNYGPWNDQCLELLTGLPGIVLLEGNHEALFLGKEPVSDELVLVQLFYKASIAQFSRQDLIQNLPSKITQYDFQFSHTIDGLKVYPDSNIVPTGNCFIGHTHHSFVIERGDYRIINPGSVGQNRRRLDTACYALFDTVSREVSLESVHYPVARLLNEMRSLGYPAECLAYYESKL